MKNINIYTQKPQQTLNRINTKKLIPRKIIVKMFKI